MKKFNLILKIFIGFTILSCSSDDQSNTPNNIDPIIGVWNEVRVVDIFGNDTFISNSDACEMMNTQAFNDNQAYAFTFFDNEFNDCQLTFESINGTWERIGDFYNINGSFQNINTREEFDINEDAEFDSREIFIQNDTLKIRFTFPSEVTIVEYVQ